jgi:hypothetical protein
MSIEHLSQTAHRHEALVGGRRMATTEHEYETMQPSPTPEQQKAMDEAEERANRPLPPPRFPRLQAHAARPLVVAANLLDTVLDVAEALVPGFDGSATDKALTRVDMRLVSLARRINPLVKF